MAHGLPRKIRIAFIVQALLASLAVLLGGYLVSLVIKHGLVHVVLQEEADYYWQLHEASPVQPPPNTRNIRGYLLETGQSSLSLPKDLRPLEPGFHELKAADQLVLVDQRPAGRLYLVFLRSQAQRAAFWFGVVPVLITLLGIYGASWLTYRASWRIVSPVNWLARRVSQWDPRYPDASELAAERLPADVQGEARQLAAALHSLASRVGQHVARERNFTRDASHELRTPLTVIRMASDMALSTPELDPRLQRSLGRIQRAGRDMEAVIDAFLILAREADIEPQAEWFDVADIVRYEVNNAREMLAGRPVELTLEVVGNNHLLLAPPRVMHVVVSNLLRNACAYTDTGTIAVEVGNDRVVVRDSGIGMTEESLARVFEPFFRAEPARPLGTGLGLSIVRRLCERFGWRIELESAPGQGTTATVHFG
ncbi:histidine kinase [Stenotrophomonas pictorum JCM 9942]|uniref:histidine kinase n=1 Tax=Stenotrophomonas pictorum JCM 9942 TaxID=1236960 RepID=A0A0R0APX2_9GAMM|nr:HAMP domain-containing sensor histidine kinase [Stenotrophomonas pictorum]KRG42993.1 histidine kinase [Stenotrophomonas pictorum JCM 9942]